MLEQIQTYLAGQPILAGAITGAITGAGGALVVDFAAFRKWQSWQDAAKYDWGVATWRAFQGALGGFVTGGLTAAGIKLAG